jgi:hypothetical protein
MKFKLTNEIKELITAASKNPKFSEIHKEEAAEIISLKLDSGKAYPVSTDLIEYSAQLQGKIMVAYTCQVFNQSSLNLGVYFHEVIIGSGLYFPPKEVKPRVRRPQP